jgi:signal transduction histidine kinase
VLASLRSLFRRDYEIATASSPAAALELLAAGPPAHLVLTDQRMPGMTGAEFLAQIHAKYPHAIRLLMTGFSDIESVVAAINEGHVYRYVAKPWNPDELQAVVRQAAERYELAEERRQLLGELEEANRLKTAFITVASHELNTPLTIALGMLRLARQKNQDPQLVDLLATAVRGAERLQKRLDNTFKLLDEGDFARTLEGASVPAARVLAEVAADMTPFLQQRRQKLRTTSEPCDLRIAASRPHLRDVLENLLTNAIKFSPDGAELVLTAQRDGEHAVLEVVDQGEGIPAADRKHIFQPLFSTLDIMRHSSGDFGYQKRGMGVGLAVARRFVELMGGTIGFECREGQGTVFRVRLKAAN